MKSVKYLLIGGGLASQRAAAAIRKQDPTGPILLIGRENRLPYDHPPLSKDYMQGKMPLEKAYLQTREAFGEQSVELLLGRSVDRLDAAAKTATLSDGLTVSFEKALLATGGRPVRLAVPGGDLPGVHYLRTMDDAAALSAAAAPGRRAVIAGGGFIGMELAASLTQRGVKVQLLERGDRIWRRFAPESLSKYIQDACKARGVEFLFGEQVARIQRADSLLTVVTSTGRQLPCDFVCVAVGIAPELDLPRQAGLEVAGGVLVDEQLRTSHPDIYAAGDVVEFPDPYAQRRRRVEHWGGADYGGTLAGGNMAGGSGKYDLLTYVWSDLFDLHLEFAGDEAACEKTLLRGSLSDKSFAILCLRGGRLTAYFAINYKRKQYLPLQGLIKSAVPLTGKEPQIQDPAFDVATLVPAQPALGPGSLK